MIYFDNSATTRQCEQCTAAMEKAQSERFANASSLHAAGVAAHRDIEDCRAAIANAIGCTPQEILLAPSGTYCNNLAIKSALNPRHNKIVISSIEHPSVYECAAAYKAQGFEVCECDPRGGDFEREIDGNTALVSCMLVNNETGLILPADKLRGIIEKNGSPAKLHIDAVQAFGKLPVNVKKLDCDFLTVSAHKINGPKGIAALYVRRGVKAVPLLYGGEQENGLVPGTYNAPACAGFAAAVKSLEGGAREHYDALYSHFEKRAAELDFIKINRFGDHAGHIINISFDGYLGENVLHFLESRDIYVSQGSACSSHSRLRAKTLLRLGADKKRADCSVRVSFDRYSTAEQIDGFFKAAADVPKSLIRAYR